LSLPTGHGNVTDALEPNYGNLAATWMFADVVNPARGLRGLSSIRQVVGFRDVESLHLE
jgi:hypothetical protein